MNVRAVTQLEKDTILVCYDSEFHDRLFKWFFVLLCMKLYLAVEAIKPLNCQILGMSRSQVLLTTSAISCSVISCKIYYEQVNLTLK